MVVGGKQVEARPKLMRIMVMMSASLFIKISYRSVVMNELISC